MEWIILLVAVVIAFTLGRWSEKNVVRVLRNGLWKTERDRLDAESRYLDGLRRDIALVLLDEDPKLLLDAHATVADFTRVMRDADEARREAEKKVLALRYPQFTDFDFFSLRHFIPVYADDFEPREAVERYIDIGKFLVLMGTERNMLKLMSDELIADDRRILERAIERRGGRRPLLPR